MSSRYDKTGNLDDLVAAINHTQTAVKAIPEVHPICALYL